MNETNITATMVPFISSYLLYIYGSLLSLMMVFSLALSVTLLDILRSGDLNRSPFHKLHIFLLINEVLARLIGSPMTVPSFFASKWLYGTSGCQFYGFTMTLLGIATISLHAVVSVESYVVICHSEHKDKLLGKVNTIAGAFCLFHGFVWAILPFIVRIEYVFEPSRLSCCPDWSRKNMAFISSLFTFGFVLPLAVMSFCYFGIVRQIRKYSNRQVNTTRSLEECMCKTMIIIMLSFLFCWTPYALLALGNTFDLQTSLPLELTPIPLICAKSAGIWNPIIYCIKITEVRLGLFSRFHKIRNTLNAISCTKKNMVTPMPMVPSAKIKVKRQNLVMGDNSTRAGYI